MNLKMEHLVDSWKTKHGLFQSLNPFTFEIVACELLYFMMIRYDATRVQNDPNDDGISKILRSIPANKLKVLFLFLFQNPKHRKLESSDFWIFVFFCFFTKPLDDAPLPSGLHTKIAWLRKLRDIIAEELKYAVRELAVLDVDVEESGDFGDDEIEDIDEDEMSEMKKEIQKSKDSAAARQSVAQVAMRRAQLHKVNTMLDLLTGK